MSDVKEQAIGWKDLSVQRERDAKRRLPSRFRVLTLSAYSVAHLLVRLVVTAPALIFVRSLRPSSVYTLKQALLVTVVRRMSTLATSLRIPPSIDGPVDQAKLQRSAWLQPNIPPLDIAKLVSSADDEAQELVNAAIRAGVVPVPLRAFVYNGPTGTIVSAHDLAQAKKVVLALHGGAWVMGGAHEDQQGSATPTRLTEWLSSTTLVLNLEYRLAEENPFPAAVIDTLSAYAWLLEVVGLKPEQVILEGDSGGGNIALSVIHHLRLTKMLPLPGGLLLVSPAVDRTNSHQGPPGERGDIITQGLLSWGIDAYLGYGTHPAELLKSAYISPGSKRNLVELSQRHATWPKTLMSIGGTEGYGPSQRALHATLKHLAPNSIEALHVIPAAPHCSTLMPSGIFPQVTQAKQHFAKWIEEL